MPSALLSFDGGLGLSGNTATRTTAESGGSIFVAGSSDNTNCILGMLGLKFEATLRPRADV